MSIIAMVNIGRKEALTLFLGDILFFLISLWLTLFIRYFSIPDRELLHDHIVPFSFLFVVWVLVFFIAGLYGKHTVLFKRRLPSIILHAQIINIVIAGLFFFLIPYFGIAPKTNLFIYLIVSFGLIVLWRLLLFPILGIRRRRLGILIGSSDTTREILEEVNNNSRYNLEFIMNIDVDLVESSDLVGTVTDIVEQNNISIIVADTKDEKIMEALPTFYSFIFDGISIVDVGKMYEDIFERVPLSFVKNSWLIDNVSLSSKPFYDVFKRAFDIGVSLVLGIISLLMYPFVFIAIKLDDSGSIFFTTERVGKYGKNIRLHKFRSMSETENERVTRVGEILRKTRIDELPQLWSILRGDMSLIGPRPELPELVAQYEKNIPYYNIRHLVKPGLSGWAQINDYNVPRRAKIEVEKTMTKLSYDLFYAKNHSLLLDLQIGLQTVKTLLSRSGV